MSDLARIEVANAPLAPTRHASSTRGAEAVTRRLGHRSGRIVTWEG